MDTEEMFNLKTSTVYLAEAIENTKAMIEANRASIIRYFVFFLFGYRAARVTYLCPYVGPLDSKLYIHSNTLALL